MKVKTVVTAKPSEWPSLGKDAPQSTTTSSTRKDTEENVWNKEISLNLTQASGPATSNESKNNDESSKSYPKLDSDDKPNSVPKSNADKGIKKTNAKPKWSRFDDEYKSSYKNRRSTDRNEGTSRRNINGSSSNRRYESRGYRSSQSSRNTANRGKRNEDGGYTRLIRNTGEHKDSFDSKTAKQQQIIDPAALIGAQNIYGTFYFNNPNAFPIDVGVGNVKESIKRQIEYYFSEENLNRDFFIRRKMDAEGYLPFTLIASFHRVMAMSSDLALIIKAVKESDKLEVYNDFKVRTKTDPTKWPLSRDAPMTLAEATSNARIAAETTSPTNETPIVVVPMSNTLTNIPPPPVLRNSRRVNNAGAAQPKAPVVDSKPAGDSKKPENVEETIDSAPPRQMTSEEEAIWTEVKRRSKPSKDASALDESLDEKKLEKEELDFQFDEEIDHEAIPQSGGRSNNFSEFSDDDDSDESDWELSDREINKILIVTQVKSRVPKHEGNINLKII